MAIPQQLLSRCPSCYSNFVNFWCQFTCSPFQRNFLNIIETRNDSKTIKGKPNYITKVEYYVNRTYANDLFKSCQAVRIRYF